MFNELVCYFLITNMSEVRDLESNSNNSNNLIVFISLLPANSVLPKCQKSSENQCESTSLMIAY